MTPSRSHMRHVTPPAGPDASQPSSAGSRKSSGKSRSSLDASPASAATHITTPPRTPCRSLGPTLLPNVRKQDQALDPIALPLHQDASVAMASTGFPVNYHAQLARSEISCRSVSPSDYRILTPISATTIITPSSASTNSEACVDPFRSAAVAPYPLPVQAASMVHSRSTSTASGHVPSRSSPPPTADELARYAYPTYRQIPTCSSAPSANYATAVPLEAFVASYQQTQSLLQPLAAELCFESYSEPTKSTTLLDYLTAPNPTPSLVRRNAAPSRAHDRHFWWDIRNLCAWKDFDLQTVQKVPGFTQLLNQPIPEPALPAPSRSAGNTETVSDLHDCHSSFYVPKVNAALRVALGNHNMNVRPVKAQAGARPAPDFVANYDTDYERTIFGDERGRVVGLVKSFEQWNTGKRAGGPTAQIEFLRELAHLHHFMREHSCRYGFIMTEIELLCVRAGTESVPNFGLLELAAPVALKTAGRAELTACLALWYLHMLAKNAPLPGQHSWKLDVGAPAAQTRKKHLPRDPWMFKPEGREKRDAKRNRGWVFPDEALSRKECNKSKRLSKTG